MFFEPGPNHAIPQSPDATLFCVGDDWQAINGFAGLGASLLPEGSISTSRDTSTLTMPTNYRSARAIVRVGNGLDA